MKKGLQDVLSEEEIKKYEDLGILNNEVIEIFLKLVPSKKQIKQACFESEMVLVEEELKPKELVEEYQELTEPEQILALKQNLWALGCKESLRDVNSADELISLLETKTNEALIKHRQEK